MKNSYFSSSFWPTAQSDHSYLHLERCKLKVNSNHKYLGYFDIYLFDISTLILQKYFILQNSLKVIHNESINFGFKVHPIESK